MTSPADHTTDHLGSGGFVTRGWPVPWAVPANGHSWADDPRVQPRDVEAGYGFRSGMASALIGYDQHDFGPKAPHAIAPGSRDPDVPPTVQSSGVLGVSFVLHAR